MSGQELAASVYQEQGCVFMATFLGCEIGSIHVPDHWGDKDAQTAMRVVGRATHAEFRAQVERMNQLSGETLSSADFPGLFYYRMEPCD